MPDTAQQDIAYQPATKAYAFSANQAVPPPAPQPKPEPEQKPPRKPISWNFLPILLGEIAGLILIFLIFLGVFNFFNVISLSTIYPKQLGFLPHLTQFFPPTYDAKNKVWTAEGTFYQYNNEKIKVKTGLFKTMNFVYTTSSLFLTPNAQTNDTQQLPFQTGTLFDLDQKQNLGKTVKIDYKVENAVNYIETITLYK